MTEEQYYDMRNAIMERIYRHEDKFADGRPKFPRCLRADMRDLEKLEKEWRAQWK